MRALIPPFLLLIGACGPASIDVDMGENIDSDGDGLSDAGEWEHGSDPENPDSDGDGHEDGSEVDNGTDPMDAEDHPYMGGWSIDACRSDVASTGNEVGQITSQFELSDQYGEIVKLHDFCARAVLLVSGAFW
jgi:hypothetical protein